MEENLSIGSLITRQDSSHQTKSENQINKELSNLPKRLSMEKEMDQKLGKCHLLLREM